MGLRLRRERSATLALGAWEVRLRGPSRIIDPVAAILEPVRLNETLPFHDVQVGPRAARGYVDGQELWSLTLPPRGWMALLSGQIVAAATVLLRQSLFAHAGVVGVDGRGWVIVGGSGAGKTSTVAVLVREGAVYLSDEIALLDPQSASVAPFALPLSLKPWTLRALGELPPGREVAADGVTRFFLPDHRGAAPLPIGGLAIIDPARPAGELTAAGRADTLMALAENPSSMRYRERLTEAFPAFAQLLRAVRCYTLGAPGPDQATRAGLLERLRQEG